MLEDHRRFGGPSSNGDLSFGLELCRPVVENQRAKDCPSRSFKVAHPVFVADLADSSYAGFHYTGDPAVSNAVSSFERDPIDATLDLSIDVQPIDPIWQDVLDRQGFASAAKNAGCHMVWGYGRQ
jgi:hypothetical protein